MEGVPVDRMGRPLYARIEDDEDDEPVLYRPLRWPPIDIDRFGESRAYGYATNHPEMLLDWSLETIELLDDEIIFLREALLEGRDSRTGRLLNARGQDRLRKTIREKRIGINSLINEVYCTMGRLAGEEFERRAKEITGYGPQLMYDFKPQNDEHRELYETCIQTSLFN